MHAGERKATCSVESVTGRLQARRTRRSVVEILTRPNPRGAYVRVVRTSFSQHQSIRCPVDDVARPLQLGFDRRGPSFRSLLVDRQGRAA